MLFPGRPAVVVVGIGAALLMPAAAEAKLAKISVAVNGTQTAQAHVIEHDAVNCSNPTGDMSETWSMRTSRPMIAVVQRLTRGNLVFDNGFTHNAQQILTRGTVTRTSTLTADGLVACGSQAATCGTRSFSQVPLQAGPDNAISGGFRGVSIGSGRVAPSDPFTACSGPAGGGPLLFPSLAYTADPLARTVFHAAIPASFIMSCRRSRMTRPLRGTLSGHVTGTTEITASTVVRLQVTVRGLGCLRGIR